MTASLWRRGVIGGGGSRDVTDQQVLDSGMSGRHGKQDERVVDREWRRLCRRDDRNDDDDDDDDNVFVDQLTDDDVSSMLSGAERSVSSRARSIHTPTLANFITMLLTVSTP